MIAAFAALSGWPHGASAATERADYELQGTYASSVGTAAPLAALGPGNAFEAATISGFDRQVLAFPQGNGLQMSDAGAQGMGGDYSVAALLRLADVSGYRRIFDGAGGTSDNGLYVHDGKIAVYHSGNAYESALPVLANNTYASVVMVVQLGLPPPDRTRVFVDGALLLDQPFCLCIGADLRFFKDNTSGGVTGEESAGKVACIRAYSGQLTDAEVAQIHADGTCTYRGVASLPALAHTGQRAAALKKCKRKKSKKKRKKCRKKANRLPM